MLVRPKVVHDSAAFLAVDHVGVETPGCPRVKGSNPRYGLPPQFGHIRVVFDLKRDVTAALRKHDSSPRADVQKGHGIGSAVPDLIHDSGAHHGDAVPAGEAESFLNLGMQA